MHGVLVTASATWHNKNDKTHDHLVHCEAERHSFGTDKMRQLCLYLALAAFPTAQSMLVKDFVDRAPANENKQRSKRNKEKIKRSAHVR